MDIKDVVNNDMVFGLHESMVASGYPMQTTPEFSTWAKNKDMERARKLALSPIGMGHDNFLNGIVVQFDLTFTVKAWTEAERYHFFDFVSSQSTMHRITKMDLDEAYIKYVDPRIIKIMKSKVEEYNTLTDEDEKEEKYLEILYSNPCGCKLTARMTTNYRQLKTIFRQRSNHRLPEWRVFCDWVKSLPYSEFITGGIDGKNSK